MQNRIYTVTARIGPRAGGGRLRIRPASRTRLLPILCSTVVVTALSFGAPAVAQVTIPDPDDATSTVDQAGDVVKDTVKDGGDTVKDVVKDPVGAVNETADEIEEAVGESAS